MNKKLERVGIELKQYWFVGFAFYMFLTALMGSLGIIGLASWQNAHPHQLDNTWINFDFYWWMVNIYEWSQFLLLGIALYYLFRKLFKKKEVIK